MPAWLEVLVTVGAATLILVVTAAIFVVFACAIFGPSERDIDL